jgi:hypothetical protein
LPKLSVFFNIDGMLMGIVCKWLNELLYFPH